MRSMLRKIIAAAAALAMLVSGVTGMANNDIKVLVNGVRLSFDVAPIMENDRTLVPMRAIFEALGAEVVWQAETQTVYASKGGDMVIVSIGSCVLQKNDSTLVLDVPPKLVDGRTLVPVRAVSESFDANVEWDEDENRVIITTADLMVPGMTAAPAAAPTATPAAAPTAAPVTVPDSVDSFDKISVPKSDKYGEADLTNKNMAYLREIKELFPYMFEIAELPKYIFENSGSIYDSIVDGSMAETVVNCWNSSMAGQILRGVKESDENYKFPGDDSDPDNLVGYFWNTEKELGLDPKSNFDSIRFYASQSGSVVCVVTFKEMDYIIESKFVGIIVSDKGEPRYFTAEEDMSGLNWDIYEITSDLDKQKVYGIGKRDDGYNSIDYNAFVDAIINIYRNNVRGYFYG